VRAVQFDMADPSFPASLVDLPEPPLPGPAWARVAVSTGGICGSDLHLFAHNTGPSPTLMGMAGAFPFVLGHETAGRVIEAGPECRVAVGTRVAVDPSSHVSRAVSNLASIAREVGHRRAYGSTARS
jgi:threonine dehydrogenase-like Zn-dependent dehydrogenase